MPRVCGSLLLSIVLLLAACSDWQISSDYLPETDFSQLHTYRWYPQSTIDDRDRAYLGGDIADRRIRGIIDELLAARGYRLIDEGIPDFQVNYDVLTEDRQEIQTYNTYGGFAPGWGYGGHYGYGGLASTTSEVVEYKQGQLFVDILEPGDDILIWRGTAEGRLAPKQSAEQREKQSRKILGKILANFPPQPR